MEIVLIGVVLIAIVGGLVFLMGKKKKGNTQGEQKEQNFQQSTSETQKPMSETHMPSQEEQPSQQTQDVNPRMPQ